VFVEEYVRSGDHLDAAKKAGYKDTHNGVTTSVLIRREVFTGVSFELLDRAGFRPVDRHEIVKHKSVEELNAQLVSLVGEDGAQLLVGAFNSRRSISGPELTK
jgi:hypothetical protein